MVSRGKGSHIALVFHMSKKSSVLDLSIITELFMYCNAWHDDA